MRISLIAALAENRVIGRENGLPWRIPGDLRRFRDITMGKAVIMGRRTFESIGKPLPGRHNIVVSRDLAFAPQNVEVARALDAALRAAEGWGDDEAMVIGGASLYEQALPRADRLYLTEVHAEVDGDTLFPDVDPAEWEELSRHEKAADGETLAHSFVVLARRVRFAVEGLPAGERARAYFSDGGYYCAEAVLKAVTDVSDRVEAVPTRVATGFCSGLSRTAGLCGALSGGVLALNLALGRDRPGAAVDANYAAVRDLVAEFETRFGSANCRDLTGEDLGTDAGRAAFRDKGQHAVCRGYAAEVADWVAGRLRDGG